MSATAAASARPPPAPSDGEPSPSTTAADAQPPRAESCVKYFDALWFCYCERVEEREGGEKRTLHPLLSIDQKHQPPSFPFTPAPGHQLRQYYRYGNVDDCTSTWASLWACLSQRTRFKDEATPPPPSHPLWRLRSVAQAREAWEREFGKAE